MSYKTFNAKNKAKKGISPVIATVILVAVAVVIAAALAGFSSSLFGTYSSAGAAVTVKSITMDSAGVGNVVLVNSGNVADKLVSMSVAGLAPVTPSEETNTATGVGAIVPLTVYPNSNGEMEASFTIAGGNFSAGQVVTLKLTLQSGSQLTQSVIVTA
jgi:flagellin-like protein